VHGGRVASREVLVRTNAVANMIRESRTAELRNVLETNADLGMTTFARDHATLANEGLVAAEAVAA
jgi:twitching motility protein PilT